MKLQRRIHENNIFFHFSFLYISLDPFCFVKQQTGYINLIYKLVFNFFIQINGFVNICRVVDNDFDTSIFFQIKPREKGKHIYFVVMHTMVHDLFLIIIIYFNYILESGDRAEDITECVVIEKPTTVYDMSMFSLLVSYAIY